MRDIKFRVWRYCDREKQFKFYYLSEVKICLNSGADVCFREKDSENWVDDPFMNIPEDIFIQQFTGMKDIDGVDIYEGDFVSLHYANQPENLPEAAGVYEVTFHRASFYLKQHKHNWFSTSFTNPKVNANLPEDQPKFLTIEFLPLGNFNICRVIGNIFDRPDLKTC